jgi:hypothetical protein
VNQRRAPEERGPFGKSTSRRGSSRTKTYTPSGATKEDKAAESNWKYFDEVFLTPKKEGGKQSGLERSVMNQETGSSQPAGNAGKQTNGEPTEVILYGFAEPFQWAAIEFYERVSMGAIYEDYDRTPPNPRYNMSLSRSAGARSVKIPQEALAKVNRYHGGDNWIKITFDSAEAADRACYYSPHKLQGYMVYAERYRGTGPHTQGAIPATAGNLSATASPQSSATSNTRTITDKGSTTVTASTNNGSIDTPTPKTPQASTSMSGIATGSSLGNGQPPNSALRIRGARKLELLPADKAILPSSSRWYRTFGAWPILGWFFSGPGDMIGNEVPLKDDGQFDWEKASMYWTFWALLDYYISFANFLGMKD